MGELINGRTPEEIKRGIKCHVSWGDCSTECPYDDVRNKPAHECIQSMTKDALALIEHLEAERDAALAKVPKWISVKERLPVKQLRVIVRTGHNMVAAGWRSYHVDVKGGELWEVDGEHNYRNDVTHWMPLPQPPEEE